MSKGTQNYECVVWNIIKVFFKDFIFKKMPSETIQKAIVYWNINNPELTVDWYPPDDYTGKWKSVLESVDSCEVIKGIPVQNLTDLKKAKQNQLKDNPKSKRDIRLGLLDL